MSTAAVTVLLSQLEEAQAEYERATAAGSKAIADGLRAQERVEVQSTRIQDLERAIALLRAAEPEVEEPTPEEPTPEEPTPEEPTPEEPTPEEPEDD